MYLCFIFSHLCIAKLLLNFQCEDNIVRKGLNTGHYCCQCQSVQSLYMWRPSCSAFCEKESFSVHIRAAHVTYILRYLRFQWLQLATWRFFAGELANWTAPQSLLFTSFPAESAMPFGRGCKLQIVVHSLLCASWWGQSRLTTVRKLGGSTGIADGVCMRLLGVGCLLHDYAWV